MKIASYRTAARVYRHRDGTARERFGGGSHIKYELRTRPHCFCLFLHPSALVSIPIDIQCSSRWATRDRARACRASTPHTASSTSSVGVALTHTITHPGAGTNFSTDAIALVGQSTTNGSVVVEIVLPFLLEAFVGVGQYCDVDASALTTWIAI